MELGELITSKFSSSAFISRETCALCAKLRHAWKEKARSGWLLGLLSFVLGVRHVLRDEAKVLDIVLRDSEGKGAGV